MVSGLSQKGHDFARERLEKAAVRQKRSYQERTREVQFKRGDCVGRSHPQLKPGKLQKKNTGPWLVLGQVGEVNYRVQRQEKTDPQVVHVDKLIPYLPDFDVVLNPWIKVDCDPREKETQTGDPLEVPGADTSEEGRENGKQPVTVHNLQTHQEKQHQKIKILSDKPVTMDAAVVPAAARPAAAQPSGQKMAMKSARRPGKGLADWPHTVVDWCKGWTWGLGDQT